MHVTFEQEINNYISAKHFGTKIDYYRHIYNKIILSLHYTCTILSCITISLTIIDYSLCKAAYYGVLLNTTFQLFYFSLWTEPPPPPPPRPTAIAF